jgi:ABC-type enterochelin transport system ATPase subunit
MVYNNNYNKNYYTIVDFPKENQTYGKFSGTCPKNAASKAYSVLFKHLKDKENLFGKFIVFVIRDINNNKEYKYIGNRIKLENPVVVSKNGKEIIYNYKNVIGIYNPDLEKI